MERRPLKTRSAAWPLAVARALAAAGLTPNAASVIGIGFAGVGGGLFGLAGSAGSPGARAALLVGAAACVQLRLVCNLLDGLIAVECGLKSKVGDLFNEVPDRLEDTALLLGAGYGATCGCGSLLGWIAALLAMGAAYVRVLGGALKLPQDFVGPGAKQQRMALLTAGTLVAAALVGAGADMTRAVLPATLALIALLTGVTIMRRLHRIATALRAR